MPATIAFAQNGWIAPNGAFYPCSKYEHLSVAARHDEWTQNWNGEPASFVHVAMMSDTPFKITDSCTYESAIVTSLQMDTALRLVEWMRARHADNVCMVAIADMCHESALSLSECA